MPVGSVTRGTTHPNRLRRVDRWVAHHPALLAAEAAPLIVDLGFGARGTTTFELASRVLAVRPDARFVGIEIDPERVATARDELERQPDHIRNRVSFARGGFEIPLPGNAAPTVIRAFNVLRQYREDEVAAAWDFMCERLAPGGLLVEGTCSEIGRVATWIGLDRAGPKTLSIALHLPSLELPSIAAERLPKALIHRNVPGERIHDLILSLDRAWLTASPLATFGARQRWVATVRGLKDAGWPVLDREDRWRLGEFTLPWESVAPQV